MKNKRTLIIAGLTIIGLTATSFALNVNLNEDQKTCTHAADKVCDKDQGNGHNCNHDKKHDGKSCSKPEENAVSKKTCNPKGDNKSCCKKETKST
ncbi:MAG TPA: hypothetical protein QGF17_06890 [Candidatus Marinimicrobia bacterium]|jgi:hypothetical protein|nr:hypothetical protein [Candidatus Neomarinimicrobiota bacterium]|tara:strand:+ start:315 stop:599 length:285 start_codon:yes stop_codon:yes gene_type:complete